MATTWADRVRRWCREPVVHFFLIGIGIFLIYSWVLSKSGKDRIVISETLIEGLCKDYLLRTGSVPSPGEKQALIDNLVDDEILIREALAMGVDQGDPILRRRLIQKMGFLIEGVNPVPDPTEAELQEYLERNREGYATPERISLTHVFLQQSGSVGQADKDVETLLEALSEGVDPGKLGDPFALGSHFARRSKQELAAKFGHRFVEKVITLPEGVWSAPIRSSYGLHLVLITARTEAQEPKLDGVRPLVVQQFKTEKQKENRRLAIRRLRDRYVIQIEGRDSHDNPINRGANTGS
jgi:hypothetical protein